MEGTHIFSLGGIGVTDDPPASLLPPGIRSRWGLFATMLILVVITYWLRYVLLPFAGAAALAFIATPVINWLTGRFGWRRRAAALTVFAVICLIGLGLGWWMKSVLVPQGTELAKNLPHLVRDMVNSAIDGRQVHMMGKAYDADSLTAAIDDATSRIINSVSLAEVAGFTAAAATGVFLVFVLLFYFLISGPQIVTGMVRMLPPRHRPAAWDIVEKIRPMLFHYFVGLVVIVVYTTVVTWLGTALILHDPHAAVTALTVGILELLPVVGPVLSGILLASTAFQRSQHLDLAIGFIVFAILLRLSIDQVVGPLVLGRAVTLHPVVIIFAFLAGGVLFGAIGVLLAIPAAATIKILLESAYGDPPRHPKRPPA
jgi:predicted PurR-regulated permease PerM